MNWIDRAIGYVAPVAGLRREAARKMLTRSAPAKRSGKRYVGRDRDFGINTGDPNDARPRRYVDRMTILRLVAENPFARKAMAALLNSLIGWGVTGSPQAGAKAATRKLNRLWTDWIALCDYDGHLDLYGLQELWAQSMFRDGEVFIVKRITKTAPGQVPLRLQTFDSGMLAIHKMGDRLERGIEYDVEGRPVAFHFYKQRRGQRSVTLDTVSFPAEDVVHLFVKEWVGQTQGVSIFEPIVKRLGDVDEGIEAELVKANISACLVGFRTRPSDPDAPDQNIGIRTEDDIEGNPIEEFRPGMIETLDYGEEMQFSTPPRTGGIGDLARLALLAAAAGVNVTYEQMTGDLSNVNFSSYRAGALEFKRTIGRLQYLHFIPVCLNPIFAWFTSVGYEAALLSSRIATVKWTPPPFESIDRKGDAQADILEMEAGLENRPEKLRGRGYEHDQFMTETADSLKVSQGLGLKFKGDPLDANAETASTTSAAATAA